MIWLQLIIDWLNIFGGNIKNPQDDLTTVKTVKYRSR